MDELISRQAAIDALKYDMAQLDHIIKGMSAYDVRLDAYVSQRNQVNYDIDTINNLPPAQLELCEDAVSKETLINFIKNASVWVTYKKGDSEDEAEFAENIIKQTKQAIISMIELDLPPVMLKQRTGYWYPVGMVEAVGGESAQWGSAIAYHRCSECDEQALRDDFEQEVLSKWCPHCGAKMEGDAE